MKILIADDDPICRRVTAAMLNRLGHTALCAGDGGAAWDLFLREGAEVILSDWMMPGMDGAELCRRVRAESERQPGGPYPYFVLLTSLEDQDHFMTGMRAGADDYLTKPVTQADLEARLLAAERVTRLHREMGDRNRTLYEQAHRDPLTGLYNRLRLQGDLEMLRDPIERQHETWTLALCDIDHFKQYNDCYGHLAGDDALRRVASALCATLSGDRGGTDAMAYRFGGEEFCLLLELPSTAAYAALDTVRHRVAELGVPHSGNLPSGVVTVSIGLAPLLTGPHQDVERILQQADTALYAAKRGGRNRVVSSAVE
ncbi:MAG: diguanylate cyclase [Cytophagales bacterium]|nr:diguanylate cyclase [Armatimonadota bacterium]